MRRQSFGRALLYLAVVTLLFGVLSLLPFIFNYNHIYEEGIKWLEVSSPEFAFQGGELKVNGKMPLVIEKSVAGLLIIDTSGRSDAGILKEYPAGALVTKDKVIYKKDKYQTTVYDLGGYKAFSFTRPEMIKWLEAARPFLYLFILLFSYLGLLVIRLADILIVSFFALLLYAVMKIKLTYGDIFKLTVYAATLSGLFSSLFTLLNIEIPWLAFWLAIITLTYLYLAGREIAAS